MLYTKNGSIPKPETDGTEGWVEVEMPPEAPEGKEVVWLNWQWVIRDPKPVDREGYRWKWNHDQMQWIEYSCRVSQSCRPIRYRRSQATRSRRWPAVTLRR